MANELRSKTEDEVRNGAVDFQGRLDSGEVLTGTPTVTASPAGLTFSSVQVNGSSLVVNGVTVSAGEGVQFRVSGGTAGTTYTITVECTTDASPAQTLREYLSLKVKA